MAAHHQANARGLNYTPLRKDLREIRLIYLQGARSKNDTIRCELRTISLLKATPHSFQALSYVWGTMDDGQRILVNGTSIRCTKNLYSALLHIRQVFGSTVLWIDAICINQSNIQERNHQVQLLSDIFATASRVIAWLGTAIEEGDDSTKLAFTVLRRIAHAAQEYPLDNIILVNHLPELYRPIHPKPSKTTGKLSRAMVYRYWSWKCVWSLMMEPSNWKFRAGTSISSLFRRAYWERVWILQEFALASDLLIMCGTECIDVESLIPFFTMIKREYPDITHNSPLTRGEFWKNASTLIDLRASTDPGQEDIFDLVEKTESFHATDPRDKIIALLGLSNSDIIPDYGMSVGLIYWNFAVKWLEERKDLTILIPAELTAYGRRSRSTLRPGMPSWAPDWQKMNTDIVSSAGNLHLYRASGIRPPQIELAKDLKILRAVGVTCGKIKAMGPGMTRYKVEGLQNCRDFCDEHVFSSNASIGPGELDNIDAFVRLILNDIDPIHNIRLDTRSSKYPDLALTIYGRIYDQTSRQYQLVNDHLRPYMARNRTASTLPPVDLSRLATSSEGQGTKVIPHEKTYEHIDNWNRNRRMFVMNNGYMGMGPEGTLVDDEICVLYGFDMPIVLRQIEGDTFYVGICFIVGLADGEAMSRFGERTFEIS